MDQSGGNYYRRMRDVHNALVETVQRMGGCDYRQWFARWYGARRLGCADLDWYNANVSRYDSHRHVAPATQMAEAGYKRGRNSVWDELRQDKFRTLYVADMASLSDHNVTVLLRTTGLQGVLGGRDTVRDARRILT